MDGRDEWMTVTIGRRNGQNTPAIGNTDRKLLERDMGVNSGKSYFAAGDRHKPSSRGCTFPLDSMLGVTDSRPHPTRLGKGFLGDLTRERFLWSTAQYQSQSPCISHRHCAKANNALSSISNNYHWADYVSATPPYARGVTRILYKRLKHRKWLLRNLN